MGYRHAERIYEIERKCFDAAGRYISPQSACVSVGSYGSMYYAESCRSAHRVQEVVAVPSAAVGVAVAIVVVAGCIIQCQPVTQFPNSCKQIAASSPTECVYADSLRHSNGRRTATGSAVRLQIGE